MLIGQRLKELREVKNLSQGEIARETGFARPYISRVENGHTVPNIETLEKWARALNMPLYQLLYEGDEPPQAMKIPGDTKENLWGSSGREMSGLNRLRQNLSKMDESKRKALLAFAGWMARRSKVK